MYTLMSQRDKSWGYKNIGNSLAKIWRYGCLITSICMLYSKFYPNKAPYFPDMAAKDWNFNTRGELFWNSPFKGMEFIWRSLTTPSHKKLTTYANSERYGMILELDGGSHFVLLHENTVRFLPWVLVADPFYGKIRKIAKWRITGYAVLKKV